MTDAVDAVRRIWELAGDAAESAVALRREARFTDERHEALLIEVEDRIEQIRRLAHQATVAVQTGYGPSSPKQEEPAKEIIKGYMRIVMEADDSPDSATELAEDAALVHGHDEWLEDDTHPVWDWAIEVWEEET